MEEELNELKPQVTDAHEWLKSSLETFGWHLVASLLLAHITIDSIIVVIGVGRV